MSASEGLGFEQREPGLDGHSGNEHSGSVAEAEDLAGLVGEPRG